MGTAFKIDPANFTPLDPPAQQQPMGFKIDPANFTPAPEPTGGFKIDPANFTPLDAPQGVDPGNRAVDLSQVQIAPPAPVAVPEYGLDSPLRNFEPEFGNEVIRVAGQLGVTPDDLLAVMDFETGGTMNPAELNKAGSGATGLIQFMPETAKGLGTTTEDLAKMTRAQQMAYVEKYLAPYKGKIKSRDDLYLSILNPGSIGASPEAPMATNGVEWREGTKFYKQNKGLDKDGKGYITVGDATSRVAASKPGLLEQLWTAMGAQGSPGQMPPEAYRAIDARREQATFDARAAGQPKGLGESIGESLISAIPFAGGMAPAIDAQRFQEAAGRAFEGNETPDDLQVLRAYYEDTQRGSTFPADLAAGLAGSVRLGGQAALGSVAGGPIGAFGAMAADPGDVQRRMAELQTPGVEFETDAQGQPTGRIILSPPVDDSATSAAVRTARLQGADATIEMLGGKMVGDVMGLAAKGAGKLTAKVAPKTTAAAGRFAERIGEAAPVRAARAAEIQGVVPEYLEEVMQATAAQSLGEPGADPAPLLDPTSPEAQLTAATVALLGGAPKLAAVASALRDGKPEGDPVFTEEAERLRTERQQETQGQQPGEDTQTPPPGGPDAQQGGPDEQQTEEPQPQDYTAEDPQTVSLRLGALGVVPPVDATEEDRLALLKQSEAALLARWQAEDESDAPAEPAALPPFAPPQPLAPLRQRRQKHMSGLIGEQLDAMRVLYSGRLEEGDARAQEVLDDIETVRPAQGSADASNLDSVLSSFPDMTVSTSGLIGINSFASDEVSSLRSSGLIETGVLDDGSSHEGVDPGKLWPLRQAAQQKRKETQPKVSQEEAAAGAERRAQNYDRAADAEEALGELGDQEKIREYRDKAAAIRLRQGPVTTPTTEPEPAAQPLTPRQERQRAADEAVRKQKEIDKLPQMPYEKSSAWKTKEPSQVAQPTRMKRTKIDVVGPGGKAETVAAHDILIPGFEEYQFVAVPPRGSKAKSNKSPWQIYEKNTGLLIHKNRNQPGTPDDTLESAAQQARAFWSGRKGALDDGISKRMPAAAAPTEEVQAAPEPEPAAPPAAPIPRRPAAKPKAFVVNEALDVFRKDMRNNIRPLGINRYGSRVKGGIKYEDMGGSLPPGYLNKEGSYSWDQAIMQAVDRGLLEPSAGPDELRSLLIGSNRIAKQGQPEPEPGDAAFVEPEPEPAPTSEWSPEAQAVINLYGSREKARDVLESQIERLSIQQETITPAMKKLMQELEGGNQGDMFGAPEEEEWLFDRGPGAINSPRPDAPKQPRQEDQQDTGDNADASYSRGGRQREQRASRAGEPGRLQLPELTRLARELLGGKYPGIVRKIRAIKGMNPRGVFRSGGKSPDIELRSDIFIGEELAAQQFRVRPPGRVMEKLRQDTIKELGLEDQADDVVVKAARDGKKWTARVYMRDHNLAERVLAHEIGHLVDYIPDGDLSRGNLLGRIASLKNYMKSTIADTPDNPEKPISDEEIAAWHKEAEEPVEDWVDVVRVIEEAIPGEVTVTPDDIKAVWNNVGGTAVPGLEDYIKGLGDKDRVRVAKEAMKGIVSDLLNRFKPKAGGKRTEVTGRERVTRMPSNAEIKRRLREKIQEEIKRRKLIEDEVVRRELRALTEWWKPIPSNASDGFKQYRYSGVELYADWISVLFNAPSQAAQRAPVTYAAWFAYLRNKPKVQALYDQIQAELDAGATPEVRLDEYRDMLRRGEKRFQDIAEKRNKQEALTPRNVMDWLTKTFASRAVVLPEQAREAAKQLDYMPATVVQMFRDMEGGVLNILRENGLTEEELGIYMGLRRAAGERADMANPLGQRGDTAQDQLQELRRQIGEERWPKLEEAARAFWEQRKKYIIPRLSKSSMWDEVLMEKIRDNDEYAKFTVQEFVSEFLDGNGGSWIFEQQGTLKEIANPFTETVKKDISLLRAVYLNEAKDAAATFSGATDAKVQWDGRRRAPVPPQDPKLGLLTVQRFGKIKGYYVPVEIAEFFQRDPNRAVMGFRIINALGLSNIARRVYVANNPLFGLHNLQRDLRALYQNLPGNPVTQPASILKAYYQTARDAWMDAFMDKSTPFAEELYKANVLIAGRPAFGAQDFNDSATELDRIMRRHDSAPAAEMQPWKRVGKWVFHDFNQFMERWSKFAGAKYLENQGRNLGDAQVRDMIRTRAGSPDFMERGTATPWVNQILLFSNAGVQGLRASKKAAMESPGQYAVKMIVANVLPKALMAAMIAGILDWLMGDDDEPVKKLMERIPENDRMNYTALPMGATEDGKTVYMIQPHDFTGQMLGRLVTKAFEGNVSPSDFGQAIGGMAPYSVNQLAPGFELLHDLAMMVMGQNPYDYFRGEQKIPKTTFEAGGVEMWQEYGKQAWNSLFGSIVAQVDSGKDFGDSTLGKLAGTPFVGPAMRRFIRVSDRGLDDKYRNVVESAGTEEARISLQIGQFVEGEIARYEGGPLPGDPVLRRHANEAYRRAQKEGDVLDKNYQRSAFVQRYVRAAVFAHGDPKRKATAAAGRLGRDALEGME